ncbi:MAG: Xaa-Pro peptidase family protein [Thermoanaerobaculales bacterium]|jgi:Xaa-Pro aminopeptidase|nr:Xaa-Pro peptidase family protein [Thermoanaerobaculales bacterium]
MTQSDMRGGNYAAELQAPEVYRQRRQRLAERIGGGTIVLWGAGDDRGYGDVGTFRQSSDFFYLTGVELPNAVMVLRPDDGLDALFLPPRDPNVEAWTGPKYGPGDESVAALGFGEVFSTTPTEIVLDARRRPVPGFEGRLQGWLGEPGAAIWTDVSPVGTSSELPPTHRILARLRDRMPSFAVRDLSDHLSAMRLIKDDGEVGLIRKAVAATMDGQRAAARTISPDVGEFVVDGAVYAEFRRHGAEGLAFPSIVGSGVNATTLHYDQNIGLCGDGELVVVDIGARYGYYCGDLTRTYPVNGRFNDRQRAVYDLVLSAHDRVAEAIRPGVSIFDLRKIAYEVMQASELTDDNGDTLGQYFIHGLGHHLGLDAHDPGSDEALLVPGNVITNEPGIYIPDEAMGIRIENDFLVTESGSENLSAALPTRADEIEAMTKG